MYIINPITAALIPCDALTIWRQKWVAVLVTMSAKQWFLTYPHCVLEKEEALAQLKVAFKANVIAYVVAREMHSDGETPHLHVYLKFDKKVNLNGNMTRFDLMNNETEEIYHGNYQTARSAKSVIEYCQKDGDFIADNVNTGQNYESIVKRAKQGDYQGAVDDMWENYPRMMLTNGAQVKENLRSLVPCVYQSPHKPETWEIPQQLTDWLENKSGTTALVLNGRSGTGKTSWARTLSSNHLFVSHLDQLKQITPETNLIIFDDMSFAHMPRTAKIHLCDLEQERGIHCRYAVATIPAGVARIFLTNEEDIWGEFGEKREAIDRRCTYVNLGETKLYKVP